MIRGVSFHAIGRDLELRFTSNRICQLEEKLGQTFGHIMKTLSAGDIAYRETRVLIWAGGGMASMDEAGDVIDELGIQETMRLIGKAITAAFPDVAESANASNSGNAPATA